MKALRAQMNPHFMFNTLNAIQGLFNNDRHLEANTAITKFANLMRMVLANSQHSFVTLEKELETIRLYLELEVMRYGFEYEINIADDLDLYEISIPPMIIQPFLENAIIHGIGTKKSNKRIKLELARENGHILCSIEDNGIGRKKAAELKTMKVSSHQSMGIELTSRRIKSIGKRFGSKLKYFYEDLVDEHGVGCGTRVTVSVPVGKE